MEKIIQVFAKDSRIEKVILYGSRAKGNYRPGSDIDLTVVGEGLGLRDINAMAIALDALHLPYEIDLSDYSR
ncbi:nucleotidyltransferase domain-containing protein [Anaerotalea alkaliphila]|uniref:nucleotidyltransferase domain-containing protein n=1 Tax=Anaerotalea alkaliphila TaxID=2662126 RepID=UPI001BA47E7D|nr:nucleotidyltransferase domain-containing protein [Anaerotalea alkaliphila]